MKLPEDKGSASASIALPLSDLQQLLTCVRSDEVAALHTRTLVGRSRSQRFIFEFELVSNNH